MRAYFGPTICCSIAAVSAAASGGTANDDMVDVLIVGAGWAGMGAADHLVRANKNVTFKVLEARADTGGRTRALLFGDAEKGPGKFIVERDSNWVCGVGGGASGHKHVKPTAPSVVTNPMLDLQLRANLKTAKIWGSSQNMSNYAKVFGVGGVDADPDAKLRDRANRALDCVNATAFNGKYNDSVTTRQAMAACGWNPTTEAEWAVDWVATVDDPGFPSELQSANGFAPDESYMWWGKDDNFVVDQNPRGYAKLLDVMVADTIPDGDPRLLLGATVETIAYDCAGVVVTLADGSTHAGRQLISTLPLGVLQRKHATMFVPPVPPAHAEALDSEGMVMGNLTHVVLQFPKDFAFPAKWAGLTRWVSAVAGGHDTASSGQFSEWQNLNHATMIPGSNILLSFLGDPQSSYYEGQPDAMGQAAAMKALRAQNPELTIPDPVAFFLSRHGYDPLSYGAYSGFAPGWKDKYYETILTPLHANDCPSGKVRDHDRVFWAGEAMCDDLTGFTHGGRQSGIEAAAKLLHLAGKGPNPNNVDRLCMCDW